MKATIKRFVRDESGATAIEYGLIAAGISVAIIAAVPTRQNSRAPNNRAAARRSRSSSATSRGCRARFTDIGVADRARQKTAKILCKTL